MIPIRAENPAKRIPFITVSFIIANIAVYFYQVFMLGDEGTIDFFMNYGAIPAVLVFDFNALPALPASWITLVTSMFLHGGILHLAGNMLYLWIFGNNIEDTLGHGRFILFYLLSGVAAALVHVAIFSNSLEPMIGASGAISGVLGAYLVLFPKKRVVVLVWLIILIRTFRVPAIIVLGIWFLLQINGGFASLTGEDQGIAFFAHIGGFVGGIGLLLLMRPRKRRK